MGGLKNKVDAKRQGVYQILKELALRIAQHFELLANWHVCYIVHDHNSTTVKSPKLVILP